MAERTGRDRRSEAGPEEEIIARYFKDLTFGAPSALGLADDAALLGDTAGMERVITKDMIVAGVHFFADDGARDIALKALGVNVSDLVAKAAEPEGYLLGLALPERPDPAWLEDFTSGLRSGIASWGGALIGGDLVRSDGPLVVSITAIGQVPRGRMIRRDGAGDGDQVYVTGTIGDAALGLMLRRDPALAGHWKLTDDEAAGLVARYLRPRPPIGLVPVLREFATAGLDLSDGLARDFARLCRASGRGGRIAGSRVPLSAPAEAMVGAGAIDLGHLVSGGDDYQVLATVPASAAAGFETRASEAGVVVSRIGEMTAAATEIVVEERDGRPLKLDGGGHDHFAPDG